MAKTKLGETSIQVIVPVVAKEALEQHIKNGNNGASISDLVRQLLNDYCAKNQINADFTVGGWGGYRGKGDSNS